MELSHREFRVWSGPRLYGQAMGQNACARPLPQLDQVESSTTLNNAQLHRGHCASERRVCTPTVRWWQVAQRSDENTDTFSCSHSVAVNAQEQRGGCPLPTTYTFLPYHSAGAEDAHSLSLYGGVLIQMRPCVAASAKCTSVPHAISRGAWRLYT